MRTVPGGNVLVGWLVGSATGGPSSESELLPSTTATSSKSRTTPRAPPPRSSGRRREVRDRAGFHVPLSGVPQASQSDGGRGARGAGDSKDLPTETPGPAGVVTSDQAAPLHHRTMPGAPSGSGYQPGCGGPGWPEAVVPPAALIPIARPGSASREADGSQFPPQVGGGLRAAVEHGQEHPLVR